MYLCLLEDHYKSEKVFEIIEENYQIERLNPTFMQNLSLGDVKIM